MKLFVNGVLLQVAIGGQGPALLLHGRLGSSYSWRKVMSALAEQFTVIVPDARGYGDSAKPDAGYDGLTIMDDMRQLLHTLGHRQAFVMGHDMGAHGGRRCRPPGDPGVRTTPMNRSRIRRGR